VKIKPSKKLEKVIRQVHAQTEPRATSALFGVARNLPSVRLRKILATVDFSKFAFVGVRYARSLAKTLGSSLALVHVIEPSPVFAGGENVVLAQDDLEVLEMAERRVSRMAHRLSRKDSAVRHFVRYGKPFFEISKLADARRADLIVVATHGHTGWKRFFLGSTTERVVRHAPCAVLTVPARSVRAPGRNIRPVRLRRIIVPIDFSQTSVQALAYAVTLAKEFTAEIILLHVIEPPLVRPHPSSGYTPATFEHARREGARNHLLRLSREVFNSRIPSRILLRSGKPFKEITGAAADLGADLIVLTTHGFTGLAYVMLGSTAERVVRYADCPVLVVREPRGGQKRNSQS
jgi:nucleotide-binding universal stress UspA family protein